MTDGHDLATCGEEIVHGFENFFASFAEAEHDAGLGAYSLGGDIFEYGEGAVVGGYATHVGGEASYSLHIVGDDVRFLLDDEVDQVGATLEIGYEDLHGDAGTSLLDGADGVRPVMCALVGEVVTVDRRHDYMLEV